MPLKRMRFMNTFLDNVTKGEAIAHIEQCIAERRIGHVITPNVNQIVRIENDPYFKKICEHAELLLADGHPLLWIARWFGTPIREKISGSDLVPDLCRIAEKEGYSIFLLGAAPGVAQRAADKLQLELPGLRIAGVYSPPFGFENDADEVEKIDQMLLASHADMLFVGMGVPKQDIFIYENMEKYQIPMSFSIGGTIDFIAGEQHRAPKWMRDHGMEWLYRAIRSPKRLLKRYCHDAIYILPIIWKYRERASKCRSIL